MKRILAILSVFLLAIAPVCASDGLGLRTVVIDAGHGGKDPGAVSAGSRDYESTFTLQIAKSLASRIREAYPDVKVCLTRSDDSFISLNKRADIANKAGADLFISVHINAAENTAANGYSVHVLGQSHKPNTDIYRLNLSMVQRENSVITLDDDYNPETAGFDPRNPESYIFMTMMQSAHLEQSINFAQMVIDALDGGPFSTNRGVSQDPFYVLWKTSMPSVLLELGFISNTSDLAILRSEAERKKIVDALLSAFIRYKSEYDKSMSVQVTRPAAKPAEKAEVKTVEKKAEKVVDKVVEKKSPKYGIQIFTVSKKVEEGDPRLLGYKPYYIASGKVFRHVICLCNSREEANRKKAEISVHYPDCYVVVLESDNQ